MGGVIGDSVHHVAYARHVVITEYVMRSQVQWLPVLYVEPICTCYTNRFSLHVHVSLGSCR